MGVLIAILAILGYGLQINRLLKWPVESTFIFICASLVCVLYFSGLLGCLKIATQALLAIGVLFFLGGIFSQFRNGTIAKSITPGVLFLLLSTIGLWILTRSEYYAHFVFVDDFSHWGRVSKIIADNDRLIISTDAIWFQDYPPGMALFDYLFLQFSSFSASTAMFSHGFFVLAAFAQLFSVISKSANKYVFFGISFFIYFLCYFFGSGLHTLSVDLIVGVVFGIALFGYLSDHQNDRLISIIRLVPLVMVLPLVKSIGILFSLVIVGVVICDILLGSMRGRERVRLVFASLLLTALCALTYISWGEHVKSMGVHKTFNTEISLNVVAKAFVPSLSTDRQRTTIDNFTHRVFSPYFESKINRLYGWFAICLAFVWLIWRMDTGNKPWSRFVPIAVLFGGFCAYLLVLLVLYMFSFGSHEGKLLASFDRYVNTYLIGMLIVLFGVSVAQSFIKKQDRVVTISLILICSFVMFACLGSVIREVGRVARGYQKENVKNIAKFQKVIESKTPPNSRIYFVFQESDGTENTMFNYWIIPRNGNRGCWSIGEPYADSDVWTCRMTSDEFEKELMDYDYLFIAHADKKFKDIFLPLLGSDGVDDGSLFKILKEAGHSRFRAV